MTRALSALCLSVVALLGLGSTAHAAKQKVAVLTLEVVGSMDQENLKLAKSLSNELRGLIAQSTEFALVGGAKDLVDEKLMNGCTKEELQCMAPIGARLEAELLMFGKMERTPTGFQVTIKLIKVASRQHVSTWTGDVAVKRVADEPKAVAKLAIGKLMPNQTGTLIVKVMNADRATVYIDNDPKGTVTSGLFTTTIGEGKHKLVIEPAEKGWNRYEDWIFITAGEAKNVATELTRIRPTVVEDPTKRPPDELKHETTGTVSTTRSRNTGWKVLAAGGLVTSAVAGGVWVWSYAKPISDYKALLERNQGARAQGAPDYELDSSDCGKKSAEPGDANASKWKSACSAYTYTKIAAPVTIAAGLVGAGALVYLLLKSDKATEERPVTTSGRRIKKRTFALTPVVSPDGAGATVRFDW